MTFASSISKTRHHDARGFTLIEVLIVVVLIGIIMATVGSTFAGIDRSQALKGYAERLALKIEIARDRAVQSNREWGIYFEDEAIDFAEFDPVNREWLKLTRRPFKADVIEEPFRFRVDVESYAGQESSAEEDVPKIVLFSSGEVTPFRLAVEPEDETMPTWILSSDGFGRTRFEVEEDI